MTLVLGALVVSLVLAPGASGAPIAHTSATCSDYPNQAAAQRAADTRDADGDGIYCEDLPCPCLKPGQSSPAPAPVRRPETFRGRCQRARLPDHHCTPGIVATTDAKVVCTPGYTQRVRNVSQRTKNRLYYEYGIRRHSSGQYEIDHLIPLELGGSNSIRNLFAEGAAPRPGFHQKDALENRLHALVCSGARAPHGSESNRVELAQGLPPLCRPVAQICGSSTGR
jgi:hypothetical protein